MGPKDVDSRLTGVGVASLPKLLAAHPPGLAIVEVSVNARTAEIQRVFVNIPLPTLRATVSQLLCGRIIPEVLSNSPQELDGCYVSPFTKPVTTALMRACRALNERLNTGARRVGSLSREELGEAALGLPDSSATMGACTTATEPGSPEASPSA